MRCKPEKLNYKVQALGVRRTEKICFSSGIHYVSRDQDRVGFNQCVLCKLLYIFRIWQVLANQLIGQYLSKLWQHKSCGIKNMAQLIWNKQLSLISGQLYSIGSGILGRVLRTYYLTCPGRVRCSFQPYS